MEWSNYLNQLIILFEIPDEIEKRLSRRNEYKLELSIYRTYKNCDGIFREKNIV